MLFGEQTFSIDHALRVEIHQDQALIDLFYRWKAANPEIVSFRGGHSGLGNYLGWYPADLLEKFNKFFADAQHELCRDIDNAIESNSHIYDDGRQLDGYIDEHARDYR